ncbi:hypothetical protein MUK42_03201 [Musa troglodytarum]|uniref:Small EDRK-rich factor-like N-terminal domain-containing protein n=1 Tax=Musa troglodytarum TaxID=320322 RepID=A0A9E7HV63_9LILI|nr:hypothetical protein MUK42_03201 [Musa troglodytarum]
MGGGNGQKSKTARERNMEKNKAAKGSQLESNKKAMTIQALALGLKKCYHRISQHQVLWLISFSYSDYSARCACKLLCVRHRKSNAENMPKQSIQSLMCLSASPILRSNDKLEGRL